MSDWHGSASGEANREMVLELVKQLPSDVSFEEIIRRIQFIAGVREGFEQINLHQD